MEVVNGILTSFTKEDINIILNDDQTYSYVLNVPEGVTEIKINRQINDLTKRKSFKIDTLNLPISLKKIRSSSFSNYPISKVNFKEGLESIESYAFDNCPLDKISLPSTLKSLSLNAFNNTNIKEIDLPSSIPYYCYQKSFSTYNFFKRNKNGSKAFLVNLSDYPNLENNLVGEDLIKFYQLLEILKGKEHFLKKITYAEFKALSTEKDIVKSFSSYYKAFEEVNALVNYLNDDDKTNLLKMAFSLGLFNEKTHDKAIYFITLLVNKKELTSSYLQDSFSNVILKPDQEDFINLYINTYLNNKEDLFLDKENITSKLYDNLKDIKKAIHSKNIKEITIDDAKKYLSTRKYHLPKEALKLESIIPLIENNLVTEEELNRLVTLYLKGVNNPSSKIIMTKDKEKEKYHYKWLTKDDPLNLVLGYLTCCCAKIGGEGEDIMIKSITNPLVSNLVIMDEKDEIVSKATAYYNPEDNYLLFNNLTTKKSFIDSPKTSLSDKKAVIDALKRASLDQVKENNLKEVRIGMLRNDLKDYFIKEHVPITCDDLLDNISYDNYSGDANNPSYGQGIIYKKGK